MNFRGVFFPAVLILAMAASRFLPHPDNFTPVMSVALFGSAVFANRFAGLALSLGAMAISDYFIGWHSTLPFVYGGMAIAGALGFLLRDKRGMLRVASVTLAGSVLFFIVTNFGVFLLENLYPKTVAGLWQCYVLALPFFRNSLAGDLFFSFVLFGVHHYLTRGQAMRVKTA